MTNDDPAPLFLTDQPDAPVPPALPRAKNLDEPVSGYAPQRPRPVDPIRFASTTVDSVDKVGQMAHDEITGIRDQLQTVFSEVSRGLEELAEAIKHHAAVAQEKVGKFCDQATAIIERTRQIRDTLDKQ